MAVQVTMQRASTTYLQRKMAHAERKGFFLKRFQVQKHMCALRARTVMHYNITSSCYARGLRT